MTKKTIEKEINEFLESFNLETLISFLECAIPLAELYNVEENDDWVEHAVGKDEASTIRVIRTIYLVSKLSDMHAGTLCLIKARYNKLWKRLEKIHEEIKEIKYDNQTTQPTTSCIDT